MDSHSTSKPPPSNALITPSASPPSSRSFLRSNPDHRPKKKRQRTASSSSQPAAPSPLSKQTQEPGFDLHSARKDASQRVLDVWSHLADRYSRRLDEDDIVDLRTVSLVKDRGVIRASPQKFKFGCFSQDNDPSANDASSDGAPEDDLDELDALALEGDIPNEIEKISQNIPPLQVMDPADAEDLRLFLEAENQRKELGGNEDDISSEDSDQDHGLGDSQDVLADSDDDLDPDEVAEVSTYEVPLNDVLDDDRGSVTPEPLNDQEVITDPPPEPAHVESDDELGGWDLNEGNTIYPVAHSPESDSEIEFISSSSRLSTVDSSPKIPKTVKKKPNGRPKPQVVITPKSKVKKEIRLTSVEPSTQEPPGDAPSESDVEISPTRLPPLSAKDKGKGKSIEIVPERIPSSESDDPITLLSSEFQPKLNPEISPLWEDRPKSRLVRTFSGRVRKRKRVWPSPELSETERCQNELPEPSSPAVLPAELEGDIGLASPSSLDVTTTGTHDLEAPAPSEIPPGTNTKLQHKNQPQSHSHMPSGSSSDPPIPDYFPYSQPYSPQHTRRHTRRHSSKYSPPPPFYPIQDLRAQYIISQAMHQLSCLMTGMPPHAAAQPWPPLPPPPLPPSHQQQHDAGYQPSSYLPYQNVHWPPYTPTHHPQYHPPYPSSSSPSRSSSPVQVFTTPTHPRPHPHPHAYDPSLSGGTLPPSSPDPPSSPPPRAGTGAESSPAQERPKSLVRRSKSRGRRVSFRLDDDDGEHIQRILFADRELDQVDDHRMLARPSSPSLPKSTLVIPDTPSQVSPSKRGRGRSSSTGHIMSSPHPEKSPDSATKGQGKGKGKSKSKGTRKGKTRENVQGRRRSPDDDDDNLDASACLMYNNSPTESARGRRFVRGQTPGPPSRAESSRPATPPGNAGRARSGRGDVFGSYGSAS